MNFNTSTSFKSNSDLTTQGATSMSSRNQFFDPYLNSNPQAVSSSKFQSATIQEDEVFLSTNGYCLDHDFFQEFYPSNNYFQNDFMFDQEQLVHSSCETKPMGKKEPNKTLSKSSTLMTMGPKNKKLLSPRKCSNIKPFLSTGQKITKGSKQINKEQHHFTEGKKHVVDHTYRDFSFFDFNLPYLQHFGQIKQKRKFPLKLHYILENASLDGITQVFSWLSHGRAFRIYNSEKFVQHVLQTYFKMSKMSSFYRQLTDYGFKRITRGEDAGCYYHERFLRGMPLLCYRITRSRIKGNGCRASNNPKEEPCFYDMPYAGLDPSPEPSVAPLEENSTLDDTFNIDFVHGLEDKSDEEIEEMFHVLSG
mmetsp:Transcript_24514/g.56009  ORF Transcript_24514/g.56009 Transcript_24514/m.56009 type:complete len:364 (-) Transcript_24514:330-1421(-)